MAISFLHGVCLHFGRLGAHACGGFHWHHHCHSMMWWCHYRSIRRDLAQCGVDVTMVGDGVWRFGDSNVARVVMLCSFQFDYAPMPYVRTASFLCGLLPRLHSHLVDLCAGIRLELGRHGWKLYITFVGANSISGCAHGHRWIDNMKAPLALFPYRSCIILLFPMAVTSIDLLLVFLFGGYVVPLFTVSAINRLGQVCWVELASFCLAMVVIFYLALFGRVWASPTIEKSTKKSRFGGFGLCPQNSIGPKTTPV